MAYGTGTFSLNADQILQAGWSRIGGEQVTSVEAKQGQVALNLLIMDMANRGVNLFSVERKYFNLLEGNGRYFPDVDTIDILNATLRFSADAVRRTATLSNPFTTLLNSTTVTVVDASFGGLPGDIVQYSGATTVGGLDLNSDYQIITVIDENTYTITAASAATSAQVAGGGTAVTADYASFNELPLFPLSRDDYAFQPNKYITGQPYAYWFDRKIQPCVNILFLPDQSGWQMIYYRTRRLASVDKLSNDVEFPFRFVPSLVSGMAYFLSDIRSVGPGAVPIERRQELKARYQEDLQAAIDEDVEDAPLRLAPDYSTYFR